MSNSALPKSVPLRALVVEDYELDAKLLMRELKQGGLDVEWKRVDSEAAMRACLGSAPWDLIVSDFIIPGFGGLQALELYRELGLDIPFIVVSGAVDEDAAVECMRQGAHDYLMKDQLTRFCEAVRRELREAVTRREHREARAALAERERYFRSLLYGLHEDILVIDRDYRITDVNNSFVKTVGVSREEVAGRHCYEVTHGYSSPCDQNGERCPLRETMRTGEPGSYIHEHVHADGSSRQVHIRLSPVTDASGNVTHVVEAIRDVTDVLTARSAQAEAVARYQAYVEHSPAAVLAADERGQLVDVNPAACRLLGYTRRELLELSICGIHLALDCDGLSEDLHRLKKGGMRRQESAMRRADGTFVHVDLSVVALGDAGYLASCVDISESRRIRSELQQSQEILRAVLDSIPARVFWKDHDLNYLGCNTSFARDVGFSRPEDVVGKDDYAICLREQAELYRAFDRAVIESGEARLLYEERRTTFSGEAIHLTSKVPLRDSEGRSIGVLGTYLDISERKHAEEESERLRSQLVQSQKLEAIGTMASGVAHEINNPIMGIMNYAELIRDKSNGDETTSEYAGEIIFEGKRVATIVRNLLAFARQESAGRSAARMTDIVSGTLALIQAVMRHDQIALEIDVSEDLPRVLCRSQQIQQVLMNLLTNARDALNERFEGHHEDKIIRVSADLLKQDGSTPRVRLTIEDQGGGIAPDVRDQIFDPFYTTKGRDKGTGLGLSISHGIVVEHGGRLSMETELGQGTRFHIDLPVGDSAHSRVSGDEPLCDIGERIREGNG